MDFNSKNFVMLSHNIKNIKPDELNGNWYYSHKHDGVRAIWNGSKLLTRSKREFVTHTGTLNKKRITVLSTGIGCDNIDIVISLDIKGKYPVFIKTVFDIKKELVSGKLDKIELLILEYFRRKGIRFYEK